MPNINNNTECTLPVGTMVTIIGDPALSLTIPDNATGVLFTMQSGGFFTIDGVTTPATGVGLFVNVLMDPFFLHLYPNAPVAFFSTGFVAYQFFRTCDTYSLTSRR